MQNSYIKYILATKDINELLNKKKYKKINFFIDFNSVTKGFYNKTIIFEEINHFIENKTYPKKLLYELKDYLNDIYSKYKNYYINFIIFYDIGANTQNRSISSSYKADRSSLRDFLDDGQKELHREIKKYYFEKIPEKFNKKGFSKIIYMPEYETDFIPYFTLRNELIDSREKDTLNIILSVDKDLLQCCKYENTYQSVNIYKRSEKRMEILLYNDNNAITYIYKNYRLGDLDSNYVPLLLAMAGDKSDGIEGIKNVGIKKAINLIRTYEIPPDVNSSTKFPKELEQHKKTIINNFKLIDFESQISRIPETVKSKLKSDISY